MTLPHLSIHCGQYVTVKVVMDAGASESSANKDGLIPMFFVLTAQIKKYDGHSYSIISRYGVVPFWSNFGALTD
jgi:hypothetical protein